MNYCSDFYYKNYRYISINKKLSISIIYSLSCIPLLIFVIYSSHIRIYQKYSHIIFESNGIDSSSISLFDTMFFYGYDFFICGFFIPLVMLFMYFLINEFYFKIIYSSVLIFLLLILYGNLQSWGQSGTFLTYTALIDAIIFAKSQPNVISQYLSMRGLIKIFILIFITIWYIYSVNYIIKNRKLYILFIFFALTLLFSSFFMYSMSLFSNVKKTNLSYGFLVNSIKHFIFFNNQNQVVDKKNIVESFNYIHNIKNSKNNDLKFGIHRGSNLLLFVLETGSYRFFDTDYNKNHTLFKKLNKSLYVGKNHYSTFPASFESNLSILMGIYPPRSYYNTCVMEYLNNGKDLNTIFNKLKYNGYLTSIFVPFKGQLPVDKVLFEHTGFNKIFYGERYKNDNLTSDESALIELKNDLHDAINDKKKFAFGFFPQIGHGPWSENLGESIVERGGRLVAKQLDWIEGIVDILIKNNILEETIIVITGDHGVRTIAEDKSVKAGMIDDYSFHVPLFIYAKKSNYPNEVQHNYSSHVDITSEIYYLLGIKKDIWMQGYPLHELENNERNIFFFGNWYYGSDGFKFKDKFYMYSGTLDISFVNNSLSFDKHKIIKNELERSEVNKIVENAISLQDIWVNEYVCQ